MRKCTALCMACRHVCITGSDDYCLASKKAGMQHVCRILPELWQLRSWYAVCMYLYIGARTECSSIPCSQRYEIRTSRHSLHVLILVFCRLFREIVCKRTFFSAVHLRPKVSETEINPINWQCASLQEGAAASRWRPAALQLHIPLLDVSSCCLATAAT